MRKGFTIIELLITILIIGIIASLAIVGLNSVRGKSRDARRISDIRQIQNALEIYRNDNSVYPSAITSGQPMTGENDYTYMPKVPSAPGVNDGDCASDAYTYASTNTSTTYSITYCLGGIVQNVGPGNLIAIPGDIGVVAAEEGAPVAQEVTASPGTTSGATGHANVKVSDSSYCISDSGGEEFTLQLYWGGTWVHGDSKYNGSTFGAVEAYVSFGGATDTWGNALTPAIVNDSGFGVFSDQNGSQITVTNFGFDIPSTATIDGIIVEMQGKDAYNGGPEMNTPYVNHIQMTVYYTD